MNIKWLPSCQKKKILYQISDIFSDRRYYSRVTPSYYWKGVIIELLAFTALFIEYIFKSTPLSIWTFFKM